MPAEDFTRLGDGPLKLCRVHVIASRARLRAAESPDRDALIVLADRVAELPGVARALVRPSTGSLIIESTGPIDEVLKRIEGEGIARLVQSPKPPPVKQVVQMGMLKADMELKKRTQDSLDFNTFIALALLFGSIVQLSRGRVAGPATTLATSALALLEKSRR